MKVRHMQTSKVKPAVVFMAVTVVLALLIMGGVQFMKGRNDTIAGSPPVPSSPLPEQPAPQPPANEGGQPAPTLAPSAPAAPQVPQTGATPAPATPSHVPSTGPGLDFFLSTLGFALTIYFALRLRQSKFAYRRLS